MSIGINAADNTALLLTLYLDLLLTTFKKAITVELLADASRHGGTEMTVISIWSPEVGKAGFLPPQVVRETKHRTSKAGSFFPEEHRKLLSGADWKLFLRVDVTELIKSDCKT